MSELERRTEELKRSRPPGPAWEWHKAGEDGVFDWLFRDPKSGREYRVFLTEIDNDIPWYAWHAQVKDGTGKALYDTIFSNKEAMNSWAKEIGKNASVDGRVGLPPKYYARTIEAIKNTPGSWDSYKIGVFQRTPEGDKWIGEYIRHYSLMETFHWFTLQGKDYALYSAPDYTATRIMSLPDCKDIGGEEPESNGFCPVEFYVPSYVEREFTDEHLKGYKYRIYEPQADNLPVSPTCRPLTGLVHEPFGFVAGCVWGDDTSWKIEYLDLSEADKGIIKRDARFGYIEMPGNMRLREAINMGEGESDWIRISHEASFHHKTGRPSHDPLGDLDTILKGCTHSGPASPILPSETYQITLLGTDYQRLLDIVRNR